ncbi:mitochondrial assembly of ribosomal large subunit protein 1 [Daktulosphaira vitifoliae]|uniref:mitochondrial assembly of ribosomal large subunit protein 1 n=1 Tax=Daktulosphaira vitifoliae TaxID=58002 RepID=UPI0021A99235|nr:mitochondrial assembly of ribosomal large subunit protein 1 [Daktulosphaira vitifoliae]
MLLSSVSRRLINSFMLNNICSQCIQKQSLVLTKQLFTYSWVRQNSSSNKKNEEFIKTSSDKYKVFKDDESMVILDIEEERALHEVDHRELNQDFFEKDEFSGLNITRGVSGVYEVEDLVEVLNKDNAIDIFVASVPHNVRYVDYIVIASGKSSKHLMAIAEFVIKLYKKKRGPMDLIPRILNKKPTDWIALDLGNIALHLLTTKSRENFDLETFWSVGEKYDTLINAPEDSLVTLLNENSFSLDGLEPRVDSSQQNN